MQFIASLPYDKSKENRLMDVFLYYSNFIALMGDILLTI